MRAISIERQLFANQLWETVGFAAKAGFMLGLTPLMIRSWGIRGYGEFALASSIFVLLSLTDLGIRARTRLALCRAVGQQKSESAHAFLQGVITFSLVALVTIGVCYLFSILDLESRLFRIPREHRFLLFDTATLAMGVMLSGLLLEPLVAVGRIGWLKCATAAGWSASIPAVAAVLWFQGSVFLAVAGWLGCLLVANLLTLFVNVSCYQGLLNCRVHLTGLLSILGESFWFNLCNATWAAKTYGTTLLLSALFGPGIAGLFFILLRLSEVISMLGAISCDVMIGDLARGQSIEARRRSFQASYRYAVLLCIHLAILIGFCTSDIYRLWLPAAPALPYYTGAIVAALGLTSALNRKAVYAAMGLGAVKVAARCGLMEAVIFLALTGLLPTSLSVIDRLGFACLAVLALLPIIWKIDRELGSGFANLWLKPLSSVLPFASLSAVALAVAFYTTSLYAKGCSVSLAALLLILNVLYLFRKKRTLQTDTADSNYKEDASLFLTPTTHS